MIRQIVLTEEEYAEIKQIKIEHSEFKNLLIELQNTNEKYEKFKVVVSKMFLNEKGNFEYNERPIARNTLFLNDEIIAQIFNSF